MNAVPTYVVEGPNAQRASARRNARRRVEAGSALFAAGTGLNEGVNRRLARHIPKGAGLAGEVKARTRLPHIGGRLGARGLQFAGAPLIAAGVKGMLKPKQDQGKIDLRSEVVRPAMHNATYGITQKALLPRPKAMRRVGQLVPNPRPTRGVGVGGGGSRQFGVMKAWTSHDEHRLEQHRAVGRAGLVFGGSSGLAALGLRVPGGARVLASRGVKGAAKVAAHEGKATRASNTLGVVSIGTGSAASFNGASQAKLERRKAREMTVAKALGDVGQRSHFPAPLASRVSPQAEASYNRMHRERRDMRNEAVGQGALAGLLTAAAGEQIRHRSGGKWSLAASAAGAATTAYGAARSARRARGRTRAMNTIESAARRRQHAGLYGAGRDKTPVDPTSRAKNLARSA